MLLIWNLFTIFFLEIFMIFSSILRFALIKCNNTIFFLSSLLNLFRCWREKSWLTFSTVCRCWCYYYIRCCHSVRWYANFSRTTIKIHPNSIKTFLLLFFSTSIWLIGWFACLFAHFLVVPLSTCKSMQTKRRTFPKMVHNNKILHSHAHIIFDVYAHERKKN